MDFKQADMNRLKFIFFNSIGMILIGSGIVSLAIELAWMLISGENAIPVERLLFNFVVGLFISTALVFLQLLMMKFKKQPLVGYLGGVLVIAAILGAVFVHTGLTTGNWQLDAKWLVIFIVAESLSLLLLSSWYRQINLYHQKLEKKKASLKSGEAR